MAVIDDLDKKYKEMFPETAVKTEETDLDQKYLKMFEPEKYTPGAAKTPVAEAKPIGLFSWETIRQLPAVFKALPGDVKQSIKEFPDRFRRWDLGLAPEEPIPEKKWIWEYTKEEKEAMEEEERQKIHKMVEEQELLLTDPDRQKRFEERIRTEFTETPEIPEDYKEPTSLVGQFWEGIRSGWESTVQPAIGYSLENIGRVFGVKKLAEWGEEMGTKATIDFLKKPQLLRPEDLKPFTEGGWKDPRYYGRVIGETLPFSLTAIGTATLGGLLGGPAGAYVGGFGASYAIEQSNSYQKMLQEGIPTDKALAASNAYGAIAAWIENMFGFSPAEIGGNIASKEILQKVVVSSYKDYLMTTLPKIGIEILKKSAEEGGEEIAQGIAENLAAKWVGSNREIFTKDLIEEFIAGAIGALPLGVTEIQIPNIEIQTPEMINVEPTAIEEVVKPITPNEVKEKVAVKEKTAIEIAPKEVVKKAGTTVTIVTATEARNLGMKIIPEDITTFDTKTVEARLYSELSALGVNVTEQASVVEDIADKISGAVKDTEGIAEKTETFVSGIQNSVIGMAKEVAKKPLTVAVVEKAKEAAVPIEEVVYVKGFIKDSDLVGKTDVQIQEFLKSKSDEVLTQRLSQQISAKENNLIKLELESRQKIKEITPEIVNVPLVEEKEGKVTKVAKSIEAKAIEKGITKSFEGLAEYEPITIKEQTKLVSDLMARDIESATKMVIGEIPIETGIKGAMLVKMMEDYAMEKKDANLILKIAQSPLLSETSEAGQTLRLLAEREPDSATARIQELRKLREQMAEKKRKGKTQKQIESEIKKDLDSNIKKTKPNKATWAALLEEIIC